MPIFITQGFSPHLKLSITKALKLGLESSNEEAIFYITEDLMPEEFMRRINEKLPDGTRILKAERI